MKTSVTNVMKTECDALFIFYTRENISFEDFVKCDYKAIVAVESTDAEIFESFRGIR